jgi:tetratricopeptide (TPR) repeat protein
MLINTVRILLILIPGLVAAGSAGADKARYIGSAGCVECHQQKNILWQASHHALAMQHADDKTVLADFDNKKFAYNGIISTFFKKENLFFVNTDGADGTLQDYQIKYTFGVFPLQQYLIEFPDGRLQALGIAWDSRSQQDGGQRWYHLYPDESLSHKDRLHWSRADQNWNYMCADCHSTNLQKNYDIENDSYQTSWSELNVACEACHGPASLHLEWAYKKAERQHSDNQQLDKNKGLQTKLNERKNVSWKFNPETGNSSRSKIKTTDHEIEICAPCHSRRSVINKNYLPGTALLDNYQPALLSEFLYYPDGQVKEEDYVYGSFIQSKMYHQGVTCSDCHEPHSLKLRAEGNGVCLQCHAENKFNKTSHHFHNENSSGASCAECHMPQTTYMGVDGRHDHSIRIPRPDLSLKLKTPNACNQCHQDKTPAWANQTMENWYGKDWSPGWHFGETLYEARNEKPGAGQDLAAVAASPKLPAIARATAIEMLPAYPSPTAYLVMQRSLKDKNELVRLSALRALDNLDAPARLQFIYPLLTDPVRAVRIEAARIMAAVPRNMLSEQQRIIIDNAIDEYIDAQRVNADRPEAHINIGLVRLSLSQFESAEKSYLQAIKLDAESINARINLADLYRLQGQDDKAEKILNQALLIAPQNADVHHALGLLYVRNKQMVKALQSLSHANALQPDNHHYAYVYAVALNSDGQTDAAIALLKKILQMHPADTDSFIALISFYKQQGNISSATLYADKLLEIRPEFGTVEQLLEAL